METKSKLNRFAAVFLALAMLLTLIPFSSIARAEEAASGSGNGVYVFEAKDLTAFAAGAKTDGDSEKAGTDKYFTLYYSAKTKVDSSSKTFDDEYSSSQRVNFGGKADAKTPMNAISFTTSNAATIKVWWAQGGEDSRQIVIYDKNGKEVVATTGTWTKNDPYVTKLEVPEAGTYFLGGKENNNYFFKVEVAEQVSQVSKEYVFESKDLTAFAAGAKADGDSEKAGTDNFFTLYYSAKTKVDSSTKTFDDEYSSSQRVNFGGKADAKTPMNAISFTTSGAATVKVWWAQGGEDSRQVVIYDKNGKEVVATTGTWTKNDPYVTKLEVPEAGTYFLGGKENNNYFFKVEVTEQVQASKEYLFESKDLTAFAAGAKADGDSEKAGTDNFFTLYYSAKTKVDSSSKTFDDEYSSSQRVNFGGKADAKTPMNAISFTTSGAATVKVWWAQGGEDSRQIVIYDKNGKEVVATTGTWTKNDPYISTLEISEAGTYFLGGKENNNYFFKVQVTDGGGAVATRGDWSKVSAPVIDKAEQADGNINVTVSAVVGNDGGDKVVVEMLDKDGKVVETRQSLAEKSEHTLTFAPKASGTYTFKATLSRDDEEAAKVSATKTCDYVLPLGQPSIVSATSMGNGKIALVWTAVDEAKSYTVFCDGNEVGTTDKTAYTVDKLTAGTKYSFTVQAVRGADKGKVSEAKEATATKDAKQVWGHIYYGISTNSANNYATGDINEDGKVTVVSDGGHGKVVPNGADGISFYYTSIPNSVNFTLRAKVTVDTWTYSNGQDGFGLLALDSMPEKPNTTTAHWTNQYMLAVSKMEYWWNDTDGKLTTNKSDSKYTMQLGVGVNTKLHITPDNLADVIASKTDVINLVAPGTQYTLETFAVDQKKDAGTYNIVGNVSNPTAMKGDTITNNGKGTTEFILEIQRNNTGYFMTYYAADGKTVIGQQKFYDTKALSVLDKDNVYVGFFAARNAKATFSDVVLTTIDPSKDAPAEEKPVEKVTPIVSIASASLANSPDYTLMATVNVDGTADISVNGTVVSTGNKLTAGTLFSKEIKLPQTGNNKIELVFTPDPNQDLGEDRVLESKDAVKKSVNVKYNVNYANQNYLYVAPDGRSSGNGSAEYPLDVYTAVSVAQPGQTIIVMEGKYTLTAPVRIERGMDGTADKPIKMIADPKAKSRPVFDFSKASEGFRLGGNYWYMRGFDVTNSANGSTGFRVCGSNNTLDQINAYNNGNTGIQISAFRDSSDPKELWPKNNLILNCTSYNNADGGYEDADGFAAKLTCGEGNVFDGCVSYNNADDGWDLYAKVSTGNIGAVTIKNCMAYNNGILLDGTLAGNGNGFKLGGDSLTAGHKLINSIAFGNKADGITSNSCPDVQVINCTSYNNGKSNLNLYTGNSGNTTNFTLEGLVSCGGTGDTIKKNTNDTSTIKEETNKVVTADAFVSTKFDKLERNADGTIKLGDFLKLKEANGSGADFDAADGSTPSKDVATITPDKDENLATVFEDNDSKIEATAPIGAFENVDDITFNADPVSEETDSKKFTFDLNFTDKDGNKVQPSVPVIVSIPVPEALKDKTIYVYHVDGKDKYTEISCTVESGMVVFTASKFSKYVITSEKLADNPATGFAPFIGLTVLAGAVAAACVFKNKRNR